ncbi:MAG: transglutaminase, partial [Bacillota bacterium]
MPASSGWYWLLAFTGLAATLTLMGGLSPFLGWPAGAREPFLLTLGAAAVLAVLTNVPLASLLLVAVVAARTGWLALVAPERLADFMASPFPGATAAAAGGVLRELWLGTYERLPAPLLVPGTLVAAALHVALVLRAARRPTTALAPVVAGGLALILAWFYGRLPRPEGWPAAYLVLSLAFTGLARLAEPAGGRAWPPAASTRRWWQSWVRRWWDPAGLWSTPRRPPATVPDPGLQEELARRSVPLRLSLPGLAQLLAVVLVAAVMALQLPPRQEPLDWVPLTRMANQLLPFTAANRPGGWGAVPGGPASAVAPRQYLGGPFFPSAMPVLTVTVEGERLPRALYLRGATRLYYDGRSWGEPVTWPAAGHRERNLDRAASPAGSPGAVSDDRRVIVQHIEPRMPLKSFLYAVLEPRAINGSPLPLDGTRPVRPVRGLLPLVTVDRTLLVGREWGQAPYTVRSVTPEFDPAAIRAAARRAMSEGRGIAEFVPPSYLQLPQDLPERVRVLAHEVTRGRDNPYDAARAIESYLRRFRYDLNMPYTPAGRDFVDYFLFDLQRGYCTAFASAAAVMLRSIGLPARWVEGFIVP